MPLKVQGSVVTINGRTPVSSSYRTSGIGTGGRPFLFLVFDDQSSVTIRELNHSIALNLKDVGPQHIVFTEGNGRQTILDFELRESPTLELVPLNQGVVQPMQTNVKVAEVLGLTDLDFPEIVTVSDETGLYFAWVEKEDGKFYVKMNTPANFSNYPGSMNQQVVVGTSASNQLLELVIDPSPALAFGASYVVASGTADCQLGLDGQGIDTSDGHDYGSTISIVNNQAIYTPGLVSAISSEPITINYSCASSGQSSVDSYIPLWIYLAP